MRFPSQLTQPFPKTVPWLVWGFFKLILPFVDPNTREKIKFNEDIRNFVPAEQLWKEGYKGDLRFEYDHKIYWPALSRLCDEKRAIKKARWIAAGKKLGESEAYMLGEGPIASMPAIPAPQATHVTIQKPVNVPVVAMAAVPVTAAAAQTVFVTLEKNISQPVPVPAQAILLPSEKKGVVASTVVDDDDDDDDDFFDAPEHYVPQRVSCG